MDHSTNDMKEYSVRKKLSGQVIVVASSSLELYGYAKFSHYQESIQNCRIHDHPTVRLLWISDLKDGILMVNADLVSSYEVFVSVVKAEVSKKLGIAQESVLFTTTHTHASYLETGFDFSGLSKAIAEEALVLKANAVEIKSLEYKAAYLPQQSMVNRRYSYPNRAFGDECIMFNTNCVIEESRLEVTGQLVSQLEFLGATSDQVGLSEHNFLSNRVDSRLNLVVFRDQNERAVGALIRFNMHPVIVSMFFTKNVLSGDFPYYLNQELKKNLGCDVMMLNGAFGDVRPLNRDYSFDEAARFGSLLAQTIWKSNPFVQPIDGTVSFEVEERGILIDIRKDLPRSYREILEKMQKLKALLENEKNPLQKKKWKDELATLDFAESNIRTQTGFWNQSVVESGKVNFRVSLLTIGSIRWMLVPGEPFVEFSKIIENGTQGALTVEGNGYWGYLPRPEDCMHGGYEVSYSAFDQDGMSRILEFCKQFNK